ncbi:palmitoyltransferase ZDHHC7 [Platysternon megacephalum]|uniref:Palmitoyltransferase ZDHHC7 n=1 Tax=Platysternon megacephalum TaxID=55544 RepID=A0A4D9ER27_9SAUR|nr:palmitoyltransferase ZDHHC7 [Platysternon megacephalum]
MGESRSVGAVAQNAPVWASPHALQSKWPPRIYPASYSEMTGKQARRRKGNVQLRRAKLSKRFPDAVALDVERLAPCRSPSLRGQGLVTSGASQLGSPICMPQAPPGTGEEQGREVGLSESNLFGMGGGDPCKVAKTGVHLASGFARPWDRINVVSTVKGPIAAVSVLLCCRHMG